MKLFLMVEVRGNLTEKEQENLLWNMMEGTDVYNTVARKSIGELKFALKQEGESQ